MTTRVQVWQRWIGRGAWALADQGLFVVSSALLNILLARWLMPAEYGAFAVAYSVFLLIGAFHVALLIEPMLVFGPGKYSGKFTAYLRVLMRANYILALAGSLLLFAVSCAFLFFGSKLIGQALLGLAISAPFTMCMWLAKRAAYVEQRTRVAAAQSVIYFLLLLFGLVALRNFHVVSVFSAMMVMGFASAIAAVWLFKRLRALSPTEESLPDHKIVITAHWVYGRWALLSGLLLWVPLNFYFVVLSTWINLEASANLKALINLVLPLLQANAALSSVLLPLLSTHTSDPSEFKSILNHALAIFAVAAISYALVIGVLGGSITDFLYGGRYRSTAKVMWLLALIPILDGIQAVLACALRSLQQPKEIFRAQLFAAVCVLAVGTAATGALGVVGAAGAMVLAGLFATMMLAISLSKHLAAPILLLRHVS